jgi:sensor histidine kinase YesM
MEKRIGQLALFTLVFYFVFGPLKNFAASGDPNSLFKIVTSYESFAIFLSSSFSFFLYTLGAYLILFYTYAKKLTSWTISLFILLIPAAISFRYLIEEVVFDYFLGFTNYYNDPSFNYYFFDNLYYAFVFTSFGVIVFFIRYTRHKELQRANYEIEQQKTQLSLLRSQINPHFIFNAMNGIYTLVHDHSEKALPAIETLSSLLRYSLYQKEEQVNLKKEWAFIEDYISLQQTRWGEPIALLIDVPDRLPNIKILSFSLIPFVENAFKHGDFQRAEIPVRISMGTSSAYFVFKIENAVKLQQKDNTGGIGLENTRKRLSLFYDNAHRLDIREIDGLFKIELKIPLALC